MRGTLGRIALISITFDGYVTTPSQACIYRNLCLRPDKMSDDDDFMQDSDQEQYVTPGCPPYGRSH